MTPDPSPPEKERMMETNTEAVPIPAADPLGPALGAIANLSRQVRDRAAAIVLDAERDCEPFLLRMEESAKVAAALEAENRPWLTGLLKQLERHAPALQNYEGATRHAREIQLHAEAALSLMSSARRGVAKAREEIEGITSQTVWIPYLEAYWTAFTPIVTATPAAIAWEISQVRVGLGWFEKNAATLPLGRVMRAAVTEAEDTPRYAQSAFSPREG